MFFGKSTFRNPKKELPVSVRRQLWGQVVLLLIVIGIAVTATAYLRRSDDLGDVANPPGAMTIEDLEEVAVESLGLGPLPADRPPEPFVERREVLAGAAMRDRTGGVDNGQVVTEEAVSYLFHKMRTHPGALAEAEPVLSASRKDEVFRELLRDPDKYRGEVVEIVGSLFSAAQGKAPLSLRGLPSEDPSGLDRCYRSYVYDKNENKFFLVYTFGNPDRYSHLDGVILRGRFCRLYTGSVVYHGALTRGTIPVLVGQDYELLPPWTRVNTDIRPLFPIAIVLPVVAAAIIFYVSYRAQRTFERRRARAREQAKKRGS